MTCRVVHVIHIYYFTLHAVQNAGLTVCEHSVTNTATNRTEFAVQFAGGSRNSLRRREWDLFSGGPVHTPDPFSQGQPVFRLGRQTDWTSVRTLTEVFARRSVYLNVKATEGIS
jgi:hypothetical protein